MKKNVVILGASNDPERFSYRAFISLKEKGYNPIPVATTTNEIQHHKVYGHLSEISDSYDTLTIYVRPSISSQLKNEILMANPKRVIFNPGTENPELEMALKTQGCHTLRACTLVLLDSDQFDQA